MYSSTNQSMSTAVEELYRTGLISTTLENNRHEIYYVGEF